MKRLAAKMLSSNCFRTTWELAEYAFRHLLVEWQT